MLGAAGPCPCYRCQRRRERRRERKAAEPAAGREHPPAGCELRCGSSARDELSPPAQASAFGVNSHLGVLCCSLLAPGAFHPVSRVKEGGWGLFLGDCCMDSLPPEAMPAPASLIALLFSVQTRGTKRDLSRPQCHSGS